MVSNIFARAPRLGGRERSDLKLVLDGSTELDSRKIEAAMEIGYPQFETSTITAMKGHLLSITLSSSKKQTSTVTIRRKG